MFCRFRQFSIIVFFYLMPFLCTASVGRSNNIVINVSTQKDFESIRDIILTHIMSGEKNIIVEFSKGKYYYSHKHIYLAYKHFPDVSISFKGRGATIISAGKNLLRNGAAVEYIEGAGFVDEQNADFHNYSCMFQSDQMVQILDENTKLCRIHCPDLEDADIIDCTNARIRITSWYTGYLYDVSRISNGYVYFIADNLAKGYTQYGNYNVNYDYTVGTILPRFRLINVLLGGCCISSTHKGIINQSNVNVIHQCESGYFMSFLDCELKSIKIEGFNLIGCRSDSQILRFRNIKLESLDIKKCSFSAARGIAIYAEDTDNISIEKCLFHDNYVDVIHLANSCANALINKNEFYMNGKSVKNSFCINCSGCNYLIANNTIRDFNCGAIGVGVWYMSAENSESSYGTVEKNHIYYTSSYLENKSSWTLIDGGAIYLWPKNDGAIIRHNFIHDYEGMGSNRGIYCDDGVCNCTIYENIILNIGNCYSIDLRRSTVLDDLRIGIKSNVNNYIFGNAFNNRFRFEGRECDSTSVKGANTILVVSNDSIPRIIVNNVFEESKDSLAIFKKNKWYRRGKRLIR